MSSKENENIQRIKAIEESLAKPENLCLPGRILLGEGSLVKICRKSEQIRKILLFNDVLIISKISSSKKLHDLNILPLEDVVISNVPFSEGYENAWNIITPKKSFMVYASSSNEKIEWMTHISRFSEQCRAKTGKKTPQTQAAVWVPDSEATVCMVCKTYTFSVIKRRHHCRKCGIVVCGPCSSNKVVLPNISPKPKRVCTNCYAKLLDKTKAAEENPFAPLSVAESKNQPNVWYSEENEWD